MTDNEYYKTRKAAADALIYWAKTGIRQFAMREAVNDYLEGGRVKTPNIKITKNSLHVLIWMYNEFCFLQKRAL